MEVAPGQRALGRARAGAAPRSPARRGSRTSRSRPRRRRRAPGWRTAAMRSRNESTSRRPTGSRFHPARTVYVFDPDGDRGHGPARGRRTAARRRRARRGARSKPTSRRRRGPSRLRSASHAVLRVAVERGERAVLGELREARRERGAQVRDPAQRADRLVVGAAPSDERVEDRRVLGDRVAVGVERRAGVLAQPRGDEHPPAVGVRDHDLAAAAPGRRAARRATAVARVEDRRVRGQRAEARRVPRAPPPTRRPRRGGPAGSTRTIPRAGRQVVAAHLGQRAPGAQLARRPARSCAPRRRRPRRRRPRPPCPSSTARGARRRRGAAALAVVVGCRSPRRPPPASPSSGAQLARERALLPARARRRSTAGRSRAGPRRGRCCARRPGASVTAGRIGSTSPPQR